MAQGRFFSVDQAQLAVNGIPYQYARIKKSPIMALRSPPDSSNFKEIFVAQNVDSYMSFIFLVKSATYQPQSDEDVLLFLKQLDRDSFS